MDLLAGDSWLYILSGGLVGLLVGMTGVGGGSLMTPLLILLFGVHPVTAVGTDLLFAAVTKSVGTLFHSVSRTVDWRIVGRLAAGSLPATIATLLVMHEAGATSAATSQLITKLLGVALLLTATALVFRRQITERYAEKIGKLPPRTTLVLTIATGAALGVLVSISSVGAGALGVMALILLYPELSVARIVGSDIVHAVPLTLLSGAGHWFLGSADFHLLGLLLMGSVPGISLGSLIAPRMPAHVLRLILAAVLVLVAVKLLTA